MSKKKAPTLADIIYRASFSKHWDDSMWADKLMVRNEIQRARKFVLDDRMSSFLGDLSNAAFMEKRRTSKMRHATIEQMRTSARLPHALTWVEFNLQEEIKRSNEIKFTSSLHPFEFVQIDPEKAPQTEGWLIEQSQDDEELFCASLFLHSPDLKDIDTWVFPLSYIWTTGDKPLQFLWNPDQPSFRDHAEDFYRNDIFHSVLPVNLKGTPTSSIVCGLTGYDTDKVTCGISRFHQYRNLDKISAEKIVSLLLEWMGVLRRMWAFFACINDIPVMARPILPAKGFVARGRYRQFLEHRIITLTVPEDKDMRKIARKAVAAARRRAHQVRGHWRKDWRHPGDRIWIKEHQRGDASIGFVTHDYSVEKRNENPSTC